MKTGSMLRRHQSREGRTPHSLMQPDDPAALEGRTRFPSTVVDADAAPRLLVSGHNNHKIGAEVQKGAWSGFPIFTLTLEERATCPSSCRHWWDCFGNKMHFARRHRHGVALENRLMREVADLAARHPDGFVVRLHVLGDFYDLGYTALWATMVDLVPALHVYGYTAWSPASPIGRFITHARFHARGRFAIRFSESPWPEWSTRTHYEAPADASDGIVCPAQLSKSECCSTCGLCWSSPRRIVFLAH